MRSLTKHAATKVAGTMAEAIGMELVSADPEKIVMRMPVTAKVKQPAGLLHGGATAALVETTASIGSMIQCPEGSTAVDIEVNCNHLKGKRDGYVEATGAPLHRGRHIHVWEVKVTDETGTLIASGRCTMAIVPSKTD